MGPGLLIQLLCAVYLTGVIWIIQLIHYPSFHVIADDQFQTFHRRHSNAMTLIVGPVMLLELGSALYLARALNPAWVINAASVIIPFGATFALSVPLHERLGKAREGAVVDRLVHTNWLRTVAWTARAVALGWVAATGSGVLT